MKTRAIAIGFAALALSGCLNRIAWMPDGRRLVYVQDSAVWLITLDGVRTKLADAAGLEGAEVAVAPRGGLIAVAGKAGRITVFDEAGKIRWTGTVPGEDVQLVPGCWSPDGTRLFADGGKRSLLIDLAAGAARQIEAGDAPRFTTAGEFVSLRVAGTRATLDRLPATGATGSTPWKLPAGLEEPSPLLLAHDAAAAWWSGKRAAHEVVVLAGADGRILFTSTRTMTAIGPDDRSYVTTEGGYALIDARTGSVTNLNPVYNALLRMDLNWQLADPVAAAEKYDAEALLKTCLPAFSPDGTRAAILTPRMVCLIMLKTAEVVAIAKW
jgi:WD40 repeat protein